MHWELLLTDREKWQEKTVNRIRRKLTRDTDVLNSQNKSEKLVVVYGLPQIGKTTLILYMLGIAPQYQSEVYRIIRAEQKAGNSSTATATVYHQSTSDQFALRYTTPKEAEKEPCYYQSDDEFQQALQQVRARVEAGQESEDILNIYIPKCYFDEEAHQHHNINMVDLPGDGGRNAQEALHVKKLVARYMESASVSIIACEAQQMQRLNTLTIRGAANWQEYPNQYMLVLTKAYGKASVKAYFEQPRAERSISFAQHIENAYKEALEAVFLQKVTVPYFLMDIGASLLCLKQELKDPEDQKEIECLVQSNAEEIRNAIQARKGNTLKSIVQNLRDSSLGVVQKEINLLVDAIEECKQEDIRLGNEQADNQEKLHIFTEERQELQQAYDDYINIEELIQDYEDEYGRRMKICSKQCRRKILGEIEGVQPKADKKVKDASGALAQKILQIVEEYLADVMLQVKSTHRLLEQQEIEVQVNALRESLQEVLDECYRKGALFRKGKIKTREAYHDAIIEFLDDVDTKHLPKLIHGMLKKEKEVLEKEYWHYQGNKMLCEKMEQKNDEIKCKQRNIKTAIRKKEEALCMLEKSREKDKALLDDYLRYAKREFQKQQREIMKKVRASNIAAQQKVNLLILLGLIEKDYRRIAGMEQIDVETR